MPIGLAFLKVTFRSLVTCSVMRWAHGDAVARPVVLPAVIVHDVRAIESPESFGHVAVPHLAHGDRVVVGADLSGNRVDRRMSIQADGRVTSAVWAVHCDVPALPAVGAE